MVKVNHDLRSYDGGTIYHRGEIAGAVGPANLQIPNVYESDESALYPVGTKLVDGERTFHYSYAAGAITNTLLGLISYDAQEAASVGSYDAAQAAGVGTVASPFKINGSSAGTPAANAYAGMYILILAARTIGRVTMRIVSHTLSAYDTTYTTVYTMECVLDRPTPIAVAANTNCDIYTNRYHDVRMPGGLTSGMYPFVGVPLINVAATRYFWLQTWGPCFITATSTQPGDVAYDRIVTFSLDGSIGLLDEDTGAGRNNQIAGYTLAADGYGSSWIMLMLDR